MSDPGKKLNDAKNLQEAVELEAYNREVFERRRKILENYDMKHALHLQRRLEYLYETKQITHQEMLAVIESQKHSSRYPLQQHNVASLIMEMEPRFAALGRFLTSLQNQLYHEYVGDTLSAGLWSVTKSPEVWLKTHTTPLPKKIDIPDLKYFVNVDADGAFEAAFVPEYIKDFLIERDENGDAIRDHNGDFKLDEIKAEIFQRHFLANVEAWLKENDYKVLKEGSTSRRIYHKDMFDADGKLKSDKKDQYLSTHDFDALKNHSTKGLGVFLDKNYSTKLKLFEEPKPTAAPSPGPRP